MISLIGGISMKRFMKKIFSVLISMVVCFFGSVNFVLASGENKVEILKDGTVLHYISTDMLSEAKNRYYGYEHDLIVYRARESRYSHIRTLAGALGILGYVGLSFATRGTSYQNSSLVLFGKILLASLAAAGVIFSDYLSWQNDKYFQVAYESVPQATAYLRSRSNVIYSQLETASAILDDAQSASDHFKNGLVVVLRPSGAKDQLLSTGVWDANELEQDGRLRDLKDHWKNN